MNVMTGAWRASVIGGLLIAAPSFAADMPTPTITAEAGFTASILVPPGHGLYDPQWLIAHDGKIYNNEDGGGFNVINADGTVSPVGHRVRSGAGESMGGFFPATGFDFAPKSWGKDAGRMFTLAQPGVGAAAIGDGHVIQRVNPGKDKADTFCTLPNNAYGKAAATGAAARFGPDGSKFAGKFFAEVLSSGTLYQATPDGACKDFVVFNDPNFKRPIGFTFSPDGAWMMVSATSADNHGIVARVSPAGKIDGVAYDVGTYSITNIAYAPKGFKTCGGCLFFGGRRATQLGEPAMGVGRGVFGYVDKTDASVHIVATGFNGRPGGIAFIGADIIWLADTNGNYARGETSDDGYITQLKVR